MRLNLKITYKIKQTILQNKFQSISPTENITPNLLLQIQNKTVFTSNLKFPSKWGKLFIVISLVFYCIKIYFVICKHNTYTRVCNYFKILRTTLYNVKKRKNIFK